MINPFSIESQTFAGETVQFTCVIPRGDIPLTISWLLDGQQPSFITSGVSTTQLGPRTSLLTISSATARHSGNYTCLAENAAGVAMFSVPLVVHGIIKIYNLVFDKVILKPSYVVMLLNLVI